MRSALGGGGGGGRLKDPVYGPGQKEFLASIRAREKAELASQRSIQRQRLAAVRQGIKQEVRAQAEAIVAVSRAESKARREGAREGARLGNRTGSRRAAAEIQVAQETKEFRRSLMGGVGSSAVGAVGAIGRAGVTAAGVGGAALAATSVSQAVRLDETVRRLSIAGRAPGEKGADPEALRRTFTNLGVETGVNPEAIASGAARFVAKTGDLTTAMANMRNFAITAQATGASIEDISSAGADLAEKFDIKSAKDMAEALAVLTFQGKKGAFELKDMAEQFPEMAAAASRAGMTGVGGMRTLGGLAQIARQSTGSGSEASTALQMMLTQLVTKADKLKSGKALGGQKVDVFEGGDPTKKARDIPTILSEIISRSEGNQTQLAKVFDIRGTRAVSPLIKVYRDAAENKVGTKEQKQDAGRRAVLDFIKLKSDSGGSWEDVKLDAADAMKSTGVQLDMLRTKLETAVASAFFPALVQLVPELEKLVPYVSQAATAFVALVSTLGQNPLSGLAAIITASVVKDLAAAGLGEAARFALQGSINGLAVGGGLALAFGAFEVGQMVVKMMEVQAQQKVDAAVAAGDAIRTKARAELEATGTLTPETALQLDQLALNEARAKGAANTLAPQLSTADGAIAGGAALSGLGPFGSVLGAGAGALFNMFGGEDTASRAIRSVGNVAGLNDATGTLAERSTLQAVEGEKFTSALIQTRELLDQYALSQRVGAEEMREALVGGATKAGEILAQGAAGSTKPNRGDAPSDKPLKAK